MLNKLPFEIIVNISLRLEVDEKLSLMLTCKRLKDVVYQTTFHDTVKIHRNKERTETALFEFRNNQAIRKRVITLKINMDNLSDELFSEIPVLFSNVEHFEDLSFINTRRPEGTLDSFIKWKDTLKSLNPDGYREFGHLCTLLENHVFPCLTDLSIGCSHDRKTSPNIRECISHAPSLVSLRVSYRTLTIDDIESIHYSCPQLSTFKSNSQNQPKKKRASLNMILI